MQTSVDLAFADGAYTFRLPMRGIIAVEQKCGPIGEVYARTLAGRYATGGNHIVVPTEGRYRMADLVEVIRQGLIGGNKGLVDGQEIAVSSILANHLIDTYVLPDHDNPVARAWELAAAILFTCVEGYEPPEEEAQKKTPGEASETSPAG